MGILWADCNYLAKRIYFNMSKWDKVIPHDSILTQVERRLEAQRAATGVSRRDFLKLSFAGFAAVSLAKIGLKGITPQHIARAMAYVNTTMPNGVAAGDVTQTSAILWTRSTALGPVTFEVAAADDFENIVATVEADVTDALLPVKVAVSDLTPNTHYFYRVTDADDSIDVGHFKTPAELGTYTGLRFGATGDWRGELSPYPSISNVLERDLQFMVGIGDTIYADYASPTVDKPQCITLEDFRLKQSEGYGTRFDVNFWAAIRGQMAYIPTIDDHEVTNDFAGGAEPSYDERFAGYAGTYVNDTELYQNGLQAFFDYNPIANTVWSTDNDRTNGKPQIFRSFTFGSDAAMFVLDNRSFRDEPLENVTDFTNIMVALNFFNASFDGQRTMLGKVQLDALLGSLQQAHTDGVTWKFVIVPEPIQNLGLAIASDRFEGYAAERTIILQFIAQNNIDNVVFISADIHGTLVNDISYQERTLGPQMPTGAFEISTGSVAFYQPFGPTVVDLAATLDLLTEDLVATYLAGNTDEKEAFMEALINAQIDPLSYPLIGLDDTDQVDAELLQGTWTATSTFGWSEFEIDAETQALTITTYGIKPYSPEEIANNPDEVLARVPQIVQQFVVRPKNFNA